MRIPEPDQRLSRISTQWTVLRAAHGSSTDAAAAARQELMERYCGAVYRYLLKGVRDADAAEELTQEFALRFIQGRFQGANPERGRFRDYVKTSLFHLVRDWRGREARRRPALPLEVAEAILPPEEDPTQEQAFVESWRKELLSRVWKALAEWQQQSGQPYYDVLRFRVEHPELKSAIIAERLSERFGRPLTADWVRKTLERARGRFADLLVDETRHSLGDAADRLEEELAELNLLKYCQAALKRQPPSE